MIADLEKAEADAGLDGAEGHAEFLGDLDMGESVEEGEFDGVLLIGWKFAEGFADIGSGLMGDGDVFGPVFGVGGVGEIFADGFEDDAGGAAAEAIEDAGAGDHHDPGFGCAAGDVVVGGLAPDLDEDVLGDVFGGGAVAQHAHGEGEDDGTDDVIAASERGVVAALHLLHDFVEGAFGHVSALLDARRRCDGHRSGGVSMM